MGAPTNYRAFVEYNEVSMAESSLGTSNSSKVLRLIEHFHFQALAESLIALSM
jgi:hypothetical protein